MTTLIDEIHCGNSGVVDSKMKPLRSEVMNRHLCKPIIIPDC
jgi:hypothetical protein